MRNEIVDKLFESRRKKILFENNDVEDMPLDDEGGILEEPESNDAILEDEKVIPLSSKSTDELRMIAVNLGADVKKLYGTSKQSLILIINKLQKQKGIKESVDTAMPDNSVNTSGPRDVEVAEACTCGSWVVKYENGTWVCDNCGREMTDKIHLKESRKAIYSFGRGEGSPVYDIVVQNPGESDRDFERRTYKKYLDDMHKKESPSDSRNVYMKYVKESEDPLTQADKDRKKGQKLIRSEAHPVSTAKKPGLDAAIAEAVKRKSLMEVNEPYYTERELIQHLRNMKEKETYIRTTHVKAGWDDVQFAAGRAGYSVSLVNDKSLLSKLGLSGSFSEFYYFKKM